MSDAVNSRFYHQNVLADWGDTSHGTSLYGTGKAHCKLVSFGDGIINCTR